MKTRDLKDIRNYIMLHGHDDMEIYEVDDKVLKVMKELVELPIPEFDGITIPYISKVLLANKARYFLDTKLLLHYVGYLSNKTLLHLLKDKRIVDIDSLVELYNKSASFISPYKIPIEYTDDSIFSGSIETQLLVTDNKEFYESILPKLKVFFNQIRLSKYTTEVGVSCYIHELMHSQLESHKGVIDNYYNSEVFSIFMELLYAYENNKLAFDVILSSRINNMIVSFNNMYLYQTEQMEDKDYELFNYCKDGKYLNSILKALNMLDLYIGSDHKVKKEILSGIQEVISGNNTVEDFLTRFDITYESSLNSEVTKKLLLKK